MHKRFRPGLKLDLSNSYVHMDPRVYGFSVGDVTYEEGVFMLGKKGNMVMARGGGYSHIWPNGDVPP